MTTSTLGTKPIRTNWGKLIPQMDSYLKSSKEKIIGQVVTDYINLFNIFDRYRDKRRTLYYLNTGFCYLNALCIGKVLTNLGMEVKYHSHCLHCWFSVDGVDYDTLYPEGYSKPVVDEWLLPELRYNENITEMKSISDQSSYNQLHLDLTYYFTKAWFKRWNINHTLYDDEHLLHIKKHHNRYQRRRLKRYYKEAIKLPIYYGEIIKHDVKPLTHYWHGEFEETTHRPLLRRVVPTSVETYKILQRDARLYGTETTRL